MTGEILTVEQAQAADQAAVAAGSPLLGLMERAGGAVAEAILRRFSPRPTLVLCGPGSNGGDGYVAARRLREAGWPVTLRGVPLAPSAHEARLCAEAFGDLEPAPVRGELDGAGLVVDALFGAGLTRPPGP